MAVDPKTASLYSRMQSYGTLTEAPRDVPDARFALPATVHWMRALAIVTVDQELNFAAGLGFYANVHARGVQIASPTPCVSSFCSSLTRWLRCWLRRTRQTWRERQLLPGTTVSTAQLPP
ncbi:hypothetical protein ABIA06_005356 [Bradyrhizobium yuanmingense]|uniref:hypothetical protein n=1 Tax=Bradyrhizobium yuanmingense TaxID=108015 RepID=UPI003513F20B